LKQTKYARLCAEESKIEKQLHNSEMEKILLHKQKEVLESTVMANVSALEKILNSKELTNLKQYVLKVAKSVLEHEKIILSAAGVAMARTISANPEYLSFFSRPGALETIALLLLDPGSVGYENEIFRLTKSNLEASADFLAKCILEGTLNTLDSPKYGIERLSGEIGQLMALCIHSPILRRLFKDFPVVP
ncbi:MAG TPA: hypothetical protein VF884_03420, partial [Nitrososphaeraceae archaeon]